MQLEIAAPGEFYRFQTPILVLHIHQHAIQSTICGQGDIIAVNAIKGGMLATTMTGKLIGEGNWRGHRFWVYQQAASYSVYIDSLEQCAGVFEELSEAIYYIEIFIAVLDARQS